MVCLGASFLALFAFYLLLAGGQTPEDLSMAAVASGLSTLLIASYLRNARFRFGWFVPPRRTWRLVISVLPQLVEVGRCLWGAIISSAHENAPRHVGDFVRQPYQQNPDVGSPRELTKNALLSILVSLLPQSFAVRRDFRDVLILHALPPRQPTRDAVWPL